MITAINSNQTFGHKCLVVLPANTDVSKIIEKVKIPNPNFNLKFVEQSALKGRVLAADEFTYIGMEKIKNTDMGKFIFDDGRTYAFQLPAFLKSIYGDARVVAMRS